MIQIVYQVLLLPFLLIADAFIWCLVFVYSLPPHRRRYDVVAKTQYAGWRADDIQKMIEAEIVVKGSQPELISIIHNGVETEEYICVYKHYWNLRKLISHNYWGVMHFLEDRQALARTIYLGFWLFVCVASHQIFGWGWYVLSLIQKV